MGTITRTYNDRANSYDYANQRKKWTVTWTYTDNVEVTGSTFSLTSPTMQAKFAYISTPQTAATYNLEMCQSGATTIGGISADWLLLWARPDTSGTKFTAGAVNTNYTITKQTPSGFSSHTKNFNTADFFNTSNKTIKTPLNIVQTYSIYLGTSGSTSAGASSNYTSSNPFQLTIGTVTLNAPPIVTLGTPIYATPQYAGLGVYTVPLTNLEAQYDGDITKVTLAVGADSMEQTYSATTVSNQTISVTPTIAGTFTPTLTVEDSRGQITTRQFPEIIVNSYTNPSVTFDVYRTDEYGVKSDEGEYSLVESIINFTYEAANLTEPEVYIDNEFTTNVTWYSVAPPYDSNSTPITDWSTVTYTGNVAPTIYGLINEQFQVEHSYQITLIEEDNLGGKSTPITQILSTAFYTIDFRAGGKEIAFGSPANDTLSQMQEEIGLFKCRMEALFENGFVVKNLIGEIKMFAGDNIPTGWLECDGHEELIADYPLLAEALGANHPDPNDTDYMLPPWGTPTEGYEYFKLPDLRGRSPIGVGLGTASDATDRILGQTGGSERVTLTTDQMPSHNHSQSGHSHNLGSYKYGSNYCAGGNKSGMGQHSSATTTVNTNSVTPPALGNTGGGQSHGNMQPYATIYYIICAV